MGKKIVRGITDIKTITKQGFDTNNVNDLLSDGEHNYIHRKKKDSTDEYHCLTDNVKTVESSDTGLLKVTNYNKTANKVTLSPQHDETKQDKLTASGGIDLTDNNLTLKIYSTYGGDLNTLIETCLAKPNSSATNLPTGASPEGIIEVKYCRGVCVQKYIPYNNSGYYIRTGYDLTNDSQKWSAWKNIYNLAATLELGEDDTRPSTNA